MRQNLPEKLDKSRASPYTATCRLDGVLVLQAEIASKMRMPLNLIWLVPA